MTTTAHTLEQQWQAEEDAVRTQLAGPGVVSLDVMREKNGLAFLGAMLRGEIPGAPIAHLLGFAPIEFGEGRAVFQGTPAMQHYNPLGSVHGGYIATLLDTAVACAVHSTLPAGKGYTTLELKVNFVRAITVKTGLIRAEGKIVSAGKQVGIAEGRIVDTKGNILAFATTTCLIFPI